MQIHAVFSMKTPDETKLFLVSYICPTVAGVSLQKQDMCKITHTHRYHTLVGVKFLSHTKTKESEKEKLLFLEELQQKQNFLV